MTEAERVANGAAWLDKEVPGWERKIDLSILDLGSCTDCICGQAMADMLDGYFCSGFDAALYRANGSANGWAVNHGFYFTSKRDMVEIEAIWASLIKERFNTGNFSDA